MAKYKDGFGFWSPRHKPESERIWIMSTIESLSYRLYWLSNGLLVYPDLYRKLYSFIIQYTHLRIVVVEPKYILSAAE